MTPRGLVGYVKAIGEDKHADVATALEAADKTITTMKATQAEGMIVALLIDARSEEATVSNAAIANLQLELAGLQDSCYESSVHAALIGEGKRMCLTG